MQAEKRMIGRSHVIVIGLMIAAVVLWLLFARPRLLGQGQSPEGAAVEQLSTERNASK